MLLRVFAIPYLNPALAFEFSGFVALTLQVVAQSLLVTIFVGSFVFWLTPKVMQKSTVEVIEPKQINSLLRRAVPDSRYWAYKGGCGRYTRAVTIPLMAHAARNQGFGRDIRISLLNPSNEELCDHYATYRRSLKSAHDGEPWTTEIVQSEIVATIVAALRTKHDEPLLDIQISLANYFSSFRLDISDLYTIVTKEDKEAAGLLADVDSYFYDSYKDDLRLTELQSQFIDYAKPIPGGTALTEEILKSIVGDLKVFSQNQIDDLNFKKILELVNSPVDPYAPKKKGLI
ncbi:hypothetical protein G3O00_03085 [Burkholderia sp. Ac-20384]|uniref:hypothetical protein n=1 Tax=Burkholderia sp. Ac-20384 TaxID=2703902 RepID=UPI00197E43C4|nr:hypothetical protein [Burkholderia sp. Ac-20384]MBN3822602.1 hypothetical protein [Burkholderia sp. Ac-20384]